MPEEMEATIVRNGLIVKWDEVGNTVTIRNAYATFVIPVEDWDEFHRWILLARNGFEPVEFPKSGGIQ